MMEALLSLGGHSVVTASDGLEALAMASRHQPCVILLDLMMPVMDGPQFRAEQLRDPGIATIPVICVSGRHDAAMVAQSMGGIPCVSKPVMMEPLLALVRTYCEAPAAPHSEGPTAD